MGMAVEKVIDPALKVYGGVITGYDLSGPLEAVEQTPSPEDVTYMPSLPGTEAPPAAKELENGIYGQILIQIGYCGRHNRKLNAIEYHRDSEVDITVDNLILILEKRQDIEEDHTYSISRMEAFPVPAGTMMEMYAATLHYASCYVKDEEFRYVIALPRDTNLGMEPVEMKDPKNKPLFVRDRWLTGYVRGGPSEGASIGLRGENLSV